MSGDVHVRFCERLGGKFPGATRLVCAFERQADAERFYQVLPRRLAKYGLEVAEDKTNLIRFSPVNWKASGAFEFLGFEIRWGRGRWGKPVIKRRTHVRNTVPPWRASGTGVASTVGYRRRYFSRS